MGDSEKKAKMNATLVIDYLGTSKNSSWWDLSSWAEDEQSVIDLLEKNKGSIHMIEYYYNQMSKSGSLKQDIDSTFSSGQKKELYKKVWGVDL